MAHSLKGEMNEWNKKITTNPSLLVNPPKSENTLGDDYIIGHIERVAIKKNFFYYAT